MLFRDMDPIRLKLDEDNDLTFEVRLEGDEPLNAEVGYRLVCEGPSMTFGFKGQVDADGVTFHLPAMDGMLKGGKYETKLEVIVGNKLLVPVKFETIFVSPTKVTVEAVKTAKKSIVEAKLIKKTVSEAKVAPKLQKPKIEQRMKESIQKKVQARSVPTLEQVWRDKQKRG